MKILRLNNIESVVLTQLDFLLYKLKDNITIYANFKLFLELMNLDPQRYQDHVTKFCSLYEWKFDKLNIPFYSSYPKEAPDLIRHEILNYIKKTYIKLTN